MELSSCKWCGKQLDARNGDECYQCFVTRLEVERNPEIAAKVLAHLTQRAADGVLSSWYCDECDCHNRPERTTCYHCGEPRR
jgi:hypothetical protein